MNLTNLKRIVQLILIFIPISFTGAFAHEPDAPFSGSIIDPLSLHHAHIENEQRLNLFSLRGVKAFEDRKRSAFEGELELAWSNKTFDFGAELFIPYIGSPSAEDYGRNDGIGDIEVRPIKYAFINTPDFILTTATGIGIPTGSERQGLGSGTTSISQYLFVDKAFSNWYVGGNLGASIDLSDEQEGEAEYGIVFAYSFIHDTGDFAAPQPEQELVFSPSVEILGGTGLRGKISGDTVLSALPGITLWWPKSGWQVHSGVLIPSSGEKEADYTVLFQIGNHFNWGKLL